MVFTTLTPKKFSEVSDYIGSEDRILEIVHVDRLEETVPTWLANLKVDNVLQIGDMRGHLWKNNLTYTIQLEEFWSQERTEKVIALTQEYFREEDRIPVLQELFAELSPEETQTQFFSA